VSAARQILNNSVAFPPDAGPCDRQLIRGHAYGRAWTNALRDCNAPRLLGRFTRTGNQEQRTETERPRP
jgi:hypothetical protein